MIYDISRDISLTEAKKKILAGGIIIYPTDTIYGFGVDATNCKAVDKLNKFKKRLKPYSIIVSSLNMMKKYGKIKENNMKMISKYFPGPYTIIINKKLSNLSPLVSCNKNTIGVRIPKSKFIVNLVDIINRPIVTTSVNINKQPVLLDTSDIIREFPNTDIFIDYNKETIDSKGSTILDHTYYPFKIIRVGDGEVI